MEVFSFIYEFGFQYIRLFFHNIKKNSKDYILIELFFDATESFQVQMQNKTS